MKFFLCLIILGFGRVFGQIQLVPLHPDGVETNEPCIAIDPKFPGTQILGSNNDLFFGSEDGGYTWTPKRLNPAEGFYGDPVVYISSSGIQFVCHLSKNKNKPWPSHFDRIVVERSVDGGKTFTSTGIGNNAGKVQDKPWIFVDEGKKSKFRNRVYISWTEFDVYGSKSPQDSSRIRVAFSDDDGATFQTPVTVNDSNGDASDDDNTLEGATVTAGPHGELYAVWAGRGQIWMDKSSDGGKTWGKDIILAKQSEGWNLNVHALLRSNSMPFVIADKKGKLYVVFGDSRNGDQDVFYLFSKDKGTTFQGPIRINSDALHNGRDQYMPNVCLDRKTNKIYTIFYDRRNSEYNRYTDVYACNIKELKPGPNIRLTDAPFCAPGKGVFFGDYISIAAARKQVRTAFTVYDQEKLFATVMVGIATEKNFKKPLQENKMPGVQFLQLRDTNLIYLHIYIPNSKSCTVEMTRGNQLFFKELINPVLVPDNELILPVEKFPSGVYELSLSFKGKKITRDVYIDRH
ncbi:MAG: exo-alpha-sialidase [Bacteroidetes bacterium]|nr:exo-alpha-sialidase [Bacteroidota bacterium]